ncbi:MAG: hypothetical protein ACE5KI_06915, partial [Dehalococcoidia bacterium]
MSSSRLAALVASLLLGPSVMVPLFLLQETVEPLANLDPPETLSFSPGPNPSTMGAEFVIAGKPERQLRILDATWHAATGQFLVVWSEHTDHTNGHQMGDDEIRGKLVNLDGTLPGADFLISEAGPLGDDSKDFPQIAHVGDTVLPAQLVSLVVWHDNRNIESEIWAQLIAPAGNALQGANFKISDDDGDFFPSLAYGQISQASGRFLVVWERRTAAAESEVYGQLVRGATTATGKNPGDLILGNFQISDPTAGRGTSPSVAFDPANDQFLVVWSDDRGGSADEREIWGQLLDTNGNDVGGNVQISAQSGFESVPLVKY